MFDKSEVEDFLYLMLHDLEASNRHVNFFIDRLKKASFSEEETESYQRLVKAGKKLDNLLDGLGLFTKLYLDAPNFDYIELEGCILASFSKICKKMNVDSSSFNISFLDPDLKAKKIAAVFSPVFVELFKNYYEAGHKEKLEVKVTKLDGDCLCKVLVGPVREGESLDIVVKPFNKNDQKGKPGLGLYFSKLVTTIMGGEFSFEKSDKKLWIVLKLSEKNT